MRYGYSLIVANLLDNYKFCAMFVLDTTSKKEGAMKMKKIFLMTAVLVFALTFGLSYAGDMTKTKDMSAEGYNGITIFARGPAVYDAGPVELGAGEVSTSGVLAEELNNGITIFARGPVTYDAGPAELAVESSALGSAAGGSREAEPIMKNGITIFHSGPVNFDD
jgi:hypothetical protein